MGVFMRPGLICIAVLAAGSPAIAVAGAGAPATAAAPPAHAPDDEEPARAARWKDLQHAIFGERVIQDGSAWMGIEAPARALDAALVPVQLTVDAAKAPKPATVPAGDKPSARGIKSIYLVIDENPGPLAGHFTFGPDGDPRSLKLRVRVNAYTYIHAVAETSDDHLYSVARFVKAAGGCSAPAGGDEQQAVQDIGHIKLRLTEPFAAGKPMQAQLMIRHPNFNGMQMNQLTRMVTPAMFIRSIDVSYDGTPVMHMDSDISLSSDPVIGFGFVPPQKGQLKVLVRDTKDAEFGQSFDVPAPAG